MGHRAASWLNVLLLVAAMSGVADAQSLSWRTRADWQRDWVFPAGTLEVGPTGSIRPLYLRKSNNASLNADTFVTATDNQGNAVSYGGILAAGASRRTADRILDGDPTSWWSVDDDTPLQDRWLEIDLGRLVTATRLTIRMRPDAPISQFAVYASDGSEAFFPGSGVKDYKLVGRTTQPSRDTLHVYDLTTERLIGGDEVPRQHVRYVYFELTSTVPDTGGLAEIEITSLGDNLMLGVIDRFGSIVSGRDGTEIDALKVADGDFTTTEDLHTTYFDWRNRGWLRIDLGSTFWLDTARIIMFRSQLGRSVVGYKLFVSDGSTQPGSSTDAILKDFVWQEVSSVETNPPQGESAERYLFEDHFQPRPVRHILWSNRNNEQVRGPATREEVAEFQIFGEGFVPGAVLRTNLIDLSGSRNLTTVHWTAETPEGTAIKIRTRTGASVEQINHYYCRNGLECEKRKWDQEAGLYGSTGPLVVEQRPDSTWSTWSRAYAFAGESFLSPSPRRYLLVETKLVSAGATIAPTLTSLRIGSTTPLAQGLSARIEPRVVAPSTPVTFSLVVRADFRSGQTGFDQLLVLTPTRAELQSVRVGLVEYEPSELDSVHVTADSLFIQLPARLRRQEPAEVELTFDAVILSDNTLFELFASDSRRTGTQRIDATAGDAVTVRLEAQERIVSQVQLSTSVVTPNGDNHNDEVVVSFLVGRLLEPRPVRAEVYNLTGRRIAVLRPEEINGRDGLGGRYTARWDARDDDDRPVPPGLYFLRLQIDAQVSTADHTATVAVAY